jgi:hypothetical protein
VEVAEAAGEEDRLAEAAGEEVEVLIVVIIRR